MMIYHNFGDESPHTPHPALCTNKGKHGLTWSRKVAVVESGYFEKKTKLTPIRKTKLSIEARSWTSLEN